VRLAYQTMDLNSVISVINSFCTLLELFLPLIQSDNPKSLECLHLIAQVLCSLVYPFAQTVISTMVPEHVPSLFLTTNDNLLSKQEKQNWISLFKFRDVLISNKEFKNSKSQKKIITLVSPFRDVDNVLALIQQINSDLGQPDIFLSQFLGRLVSLRCVEASPAPSCLKQAVQFEDVEETKELSR